MNQIILIGRIVELEKVENKATVVIAVQRNFKNENGEYETDFIKCSLYKMIAWNTLEYCEKGDMVGIKGRIQCTNGEMELIGEKVTFLSSKQKKED